MVYLNQNDKEYLSFPDSHILKMTVDTDNKKIEIQSDFCWIDSYGGLANNCIISFSEWEKFEAFLYDSDNDEYFKLNNDEIDYFDEIPVYFYEDNCVIMEGRGVRTRYWITYKIYKPKVDGTYGARLERKS